MCYIWGNSRGCRVRLRYPFCAKYATCISENFLAVPAIVTLVVACGTMGLSQCPEARQGQEYLRSARALYEEQAYANAITLGQKSLEHLAVCSQRATLPAYRFLAEANHAAGYYQEASRWALKALELQDQEIRSMAGLQYTAEVMERQLRELTMPQPSSAASGLVGSWWWLAPLMVLPALAGWWIGRKGVPQTQAQSRTKKHHRKVRSSEGGPAVFDVAKQLAPELENLQNPALTGREKEVLELMASGKSNKDIAATLYISENTTKSHIANIYMKLEVNNRTEAARKASELNLIS